MKPNPQQTSGTNAGFDVDVSALSAHHQQLGGVVDQLADALRTALETHLPEEAFGPFGAPLAAAIKPTAETAQSAFERVVESVGAERDGVDQTARTYDESERVHTGGFHRLLEAE
ncbi:MAG: type VII secretion target [Actinophytocola sp.]|uniref:hypothetical protein n=1 Tax=Actinophytocola sp. TaxID=1872138 RepID=UPI003C70AAB9